MGPDFHRCRRWITVMDRFLGMLYQIDVETLRALYRLSNRLNDDSTMMVMVSHHLNSQLRSYLLVALVWA
jgi:hypothetical protein